MRRCLTLLLLAGYVAAATAGGRLHRHDHEPCRGDRECACGHHHAPGEEDASDEHAPARGHDEGDCHVCQLLAQKPIPSEPVREVPVGVPVAELIAVKPVWLAVAAPSTTHIRAPPAVA
jgi:hypothetical protein